jgi:hypothetical protein
MKTTSNGDKPAVDRTSLQQVLDAAYVMQQHNERLHAGQPQPPDIPHLWSSLWEPQRKTENPAPEIVVESVAAGDASPEEKPAPPSTSPAAEACPRWAPGYWGMPLEACDQAVPEPLQQLKSESDAATRSQAAPTPAVPPRVVCATCDRENQRDRRFCGFCGSPLYHPKATEVSPPAVSTFGLDSRQADQLQFLREKSLGSAYYQPDSGGRSAVAVAALAIILAGVTYVEWPSLRSHVQSVLHPSPVTQLPLASTRPTRVPAIPAEAQQSGRNDNQPQGFSPPRSMPFEPEERTSDKTNTAGRSTQPVQPPVSVSPSELARLAANGTQELLLAERYLDARGVAHDSGQAAALLWKAVSEQNTRADVLLADLYLLGDGVPKSCDQARLLLVAAAKKGVPEAARKLRNIESGGCR